MSGARARICEHADAPAVAPIRTSIPEAADAPVRHFVRGEAKPRDGSRTVIGESPLVIEVIDHGRYTIMRTPGDDAALAVGFLLAEGLLAGRADLVELGGCPTKPDVVRVRLAAGHAAPGHELRNLVVSSSCGLCGREGLDELLATLPVVRAELAMAVERLYSLPEAVRARQRLFEATGGCHAAALFDVDGNVLDLREDLGRHSALDKLLGAAWLEGRPVGGHGVFLSGRSSLEMIVKAARAGVALVAAVSAPSSASVEAAERLGITLCGFVRGDEVAVYTHPERIRIGEEP